MDYWTDGTAAVSAGVVVVAAHLGDAKDLLEGLREELHTHVA